MVPGLMPFFDVADGGIEREFDFLEADYDNSAQTTYTFSGVDFGAAAADRRILVACIFRSTPNITGVTIGGVSATELLNGSSDGGSNEVHFFIAAVPTGTSGTIEVALNGSTSRMGFSAYRLANFSSYTPTDTDDDDSDATVDAVTVPSGGAAVFAGFNQQPGEAASWSNATKDTEFDTSFEVSASTASIFPGDGSTPSVSVSWSSETNEFAIGLAFF